MASDAAKGGQRVGAAQTQLSRLGYRTARVSASGQRKGKRREENGVSADIIAFAPADSGLPHLIVESGGAGKRLGVAFEEMLEHPLPPGFIALVARTIDRKMRWHVSAERGDSFSTLVDALDAVREA